LLSSATASPPIYPVAVNGTQLGYLPGETLPITSLGLICTATGTLTYSVQVSGDNPENSAGIVNWNNHDVIVNATTSLNSNIAYAVTAIFRQVAALQQPRPGILWVVLDHLVGECGVCCPTAACACYHKNARSPENHWLR
jgi:hypothetical protein